MDAASAVSEATASPTRTLSSSLTMIAHPHSSKQIYGLHYLPKFTADLTFTGQRPHRRQKEKDNLEASAAVENREQLQPLADPLSALDSPRDELSITGRLGVPRDERADGLAKNDQFHGLSGLSVNM